MSRTLINKAVPVMSPAENEFETDRKYVFDVNLVARIHVCAASETLARKVVTSALGSPSRADIRLANEASFILGNCATISDVTFSIGGDIARFASLDTIPPGVEIEVPSDQFESIGPIDQSTPEEGARRRTDVNLAVLKPGQPGR
jgi:hypothetical protein